MKRVKIGNSEKALRKASETYCVAETMKEMIEDIDCDLKAFGLEIELVTDVINGCLFKVIRR